MLQHTSDYNNEMTEDVFASGFVPDGETKRPQGADLIKLLVDKFCHEIVSNQP